MQQFFLALVKNYHAHTCLMGFSPRIGPKLVFITGVNAIFMDFFEASIAKFTCQGYR